MVAHAVAGLKIPASPHGLAYLEAAMRKMKIRWVLCKLISRGEIRWVVFQKAMRECPAAVAGRSATWIVDNQLSMGS